MKSIAQTLATIVLVFVLIGGITFVTQYVNTENPAESTSSKPPVEQKPEYKVDFPITMIETPIETEFRGKKRMDFWFENPNSEIGELGLNFQNCKCGDIEVLVLEPEERLKLAVWPPDEAAAARKEIKDILNQESRWHKLKEGERSNLMTLPPKTVGVVRVNWEGKKIDEKPQRISARLWVEAKGDPATRGGPIELSLPILVVSPFRVTRYSLPFDDVEPDAAKTMELVCWSSTRNDFKLACRIEENPNDPFFTINSAKLSPAECKQMAEKERTRMSSAYRVAATLRERTVDGRQLDMGPFRRTLLLVADGVNENRIELSGRVLGDLRISPLNENGRVDFSTFPIDIGSTRLIFLEPNQSGVNLKIETKYPEWLEVKLNPPSKSGGRWELTIKVPPNRCTGPLPTGSKVVLQTSGTSRRMVHLPLQGAGFRR